jgi:hypothetical protein
MGSIWRTTDSQARDSIEQKEKMRGDVEEGKKRN